MDYIKNITDKIMSYLKMEHEPVGIKVCFEELSGKKPSEPLPYCPFPLTSDIMKEGPFYINMKDIPCYTAHMVLGFVEPKRIPIEPRIKTKTKAIFMGSVTTFRDKCDVVLLLLRPKQAMEVAFMLNGLYAEIKGDLSICGEAIARTYEEGRSTVTLLCQASRDILPFDENSILVSLTWEDYEKLGEKIETRLKRQR